MMGRDKHFAHTTSLARWLTQRWASVTLLLIVAAFLALNSGHSSEPELWIWSYTRAIILAMAAGVIAYLLWSLNRKPLQKMHNAVGIAIPLTAAVIEIALHVQPSLIPIDALRFLPADVREELAEKRGIPTHNDYRGDGLLYSHANGTAITKSRPNIVLDTYGYRNPPGSNKQADIILLGDSVCLAMANDHDLGQLWRDAGRTALNYCMGGYAPQQYRESYRKMVIEREVEHKLVLLLLPLVGDLVEARKYDAVQRNGGDWRDYLQIDTDAGAAGSLWVKQQPFWIINILVGTPYLLKAWLGDLRDAADALIGTRGELALPYSRMSVTKGIFDGPDPRLDEDGWALYRDALADVIAMATSHGAHVGLVLLPGPGLLYGPHVIGFSAETTKPAERRDEFVRRMNTDLVVRGAELIDMTDVMSKETARRELWLSPLDYHYNATGIAALYEELAARLSARGLLAR